MIIDKTAGAGQSSGPRIRGSAELPMDCGRMVDPVWVVACTEYQAEPLARAECLKAAFQTFFPLVRILVPQTNRPPIRQTVPAFPGYLFVLTPFARWHKLRSMRGMAGVLHTVGNCEEPVVLPMDLMNGLLARAGIQGTLDLSSGDVLFERRYDRSLPAWVAPDKEAPPPPPSKREWARLAEMDPDERRELLHRVLGL